MAFKHQIGMFAENKGSSYRARSFFWVSQKRHEGCFLIWCDVYLGSFDASWLLKPYGGHIKVLNPIVLGTCSPIIPMSLDDSGGFNSHYNHLDSGTVMNGF